MATKTATGPNGEKITFRSATNPETGEQRWIQVDVAQPGLESAMGKDAVSMLTQGAQDFTQKAKNAVDEYVPDIREKISMPEGVSSYLMPDSAVDFVNEQIEKKNKYEQSFINDREAQIRRKEEAQRPFLSGVGEGMGHVGKQFYAGTLQSPDVLPDWLQNILDYRIGGDNEKTREEAAKEIEDYMAQEAKDYRIIRGENPVSTTIGEFLPYLATGTAGEAALMRTGARLNPIARQASINMNRKLGNVKEANRIRNQPNRIPSEFDQQVGAVVRGSAIGGAEGAAQYDTSAGEGAAYAGLGAFSGTFGPLRALNKVRNERDKVGKELISEMEEAGLQITPGVRTGNKTLQTEEAGIRNSDEFAQDFYNQVDRPNEMVMTKMAGEAIGLPLANRDLIGREELANHMQNLRSEFQQLEANTVGKFTKDSYNRMGRILKDMQPTKNRNVSKPAKQRYEVVKDIFNEMRKDMQRPTNMPGTGKFDWVFDGSKYQQMAQRVDSEIKTAYNQGDTILADNLKLIKKELEGAIESGMGKTNSKMWRDLNERYAMSNMLMENGLDAHGKVNARGITNSVMNNSEAARTLTGKGGRIKKFQDIARYNAVLDDVSGGSLTGLGSADTKHQQRGLFKRSLDYAAKPARLGALGYRLNTLRTPFVGRYLSPAHGISPIAGAQAGRAFGQVETMSDLIDVLTGD